MVSKEFATGLSALSLIGLYLIGAWLRKATLPILKWNKWYDLAGYLVCTLILTVISYVLLRVGITKSIYGYLNPVVIIEAIFLFQFFRKCNFGSISWVNYLAAGAFAAFLLHCDEYLGPYCNQLWRSINSSYDYSIFFAIISIILIFIVSVLIDKIRSWMWKLIMRISTTIHSTTL